MHTRPAAKKEKVVGIIFSALHDALLRFVIDENDNPARILALLDARHASNIMVFCIALQTQLFHFLCKDHDISEYIIQYNSLFAQLERQGKELAIHELPSPRCCLLVSINPDSSLLFTVAAF